MKNRKYIITAILSACVAILFTTLVSAQTVNRTADRTVQIDAGVLEGTVSGDVLSFKGIPYAAPPVGDLRWRAPQPVTAWTGVRSATRYGNDCIQLPLPGDAAASGGTTSEDCLVLNVWRPKALDPSKPLPVLVWIHGGGFLNGSSAAPIYDGSAFAQQGLVVVSFNYRLGRLGFFAHPALTAAKEGLLGNYGLLDQLAALQWIQRNIAAFGGDPKRVTLMGESAGGISVMHHLVSPKSRGLFHQAAVLSGGGRTYLMGLRKLRESSPNLPSAEESGVEFARSVGITNEGAEALTALRALPAEKVNGDMNMAALLTKPSTYAGGPIFDGDLIATTPEEILRRGEVKVPVLIGTTSADLPVTFPPAENPFSYFGAEAEQARSVYNPDGTLPLKAVVSTIAVDITMHEPARFVAKQITAAGNPAWLYRFGYVAESLRPEKMGAEHASEQPYLFSTLDARYGQAVTAKDRAMARLFHAYFANFAKSGDPNAEGLPTWSKYDPNQSELMMFTLDRDAVMQSDPWKNRLDLVERAADAQDSASDRASNAANDLGGTSWQLVQFQGGDDTTLTPDDRAKYTLAFNPDGSVYVRIDCNRGRSTWTSSELNQLRFGPLALTNALCPPGSLHDRMVRDWSFVRSYVLKDGHLFVSLMADGGIYEFEPINSSQSAPKSAPKLVTKPVFGQ